jgi:pilus assembly protein FimV
MPFLKLLEIYRRLGMRVDYERTRMNFNLRFNAHAPLWDADLTHGHELADYPGIVERLQALWPDPERALDVLERSLMRQDAESYTFDLPAYRELLFLYAVLRDLSEQPNGQDDGVDLLVPTVRGVQGEQPLMATLPMKALPDLAPTLSLDLELDDLFVDPPQPGSGSHKP